MLESTNDVHLRNEPSKYLWAVFRGGVQLDSVILERQYTGKNELSKVDTVARWRSIIQERINGLSVNPTLKVGTGPLALELATAINAVQRAAYIIRSLQRLLLQSTKTTSTKVDDTPVTVADFAVQAFIIDALSRAFPTDLFIAEEDSATVRSNNAICSSVLSILQLATGDRWTPGRLYAALDKGSHCDAGSSHHTAQPASPSQPQRVWVLDPIDGTKGFLRGEHCCTGLGLLVDGAVHLSVLGCPNLNLLRLLQGSAYDNRPITYIDLAVATGNTKYVGYQQDNNNSESQNKNVIISHPDSGSVYFAVTNQGAFARTLSMPLGSAFEVSTSEVRDASKARLCESAEAAFGDRDTTARAAAQLRMQSDFLRIDGMCKHCVVGAGAAGGTLRLPPAGYREKIWDHVAGDHFVREAGGVVTDLRGRRLDYSAVLNMLKPAKEIASGDDTSSSTLYTTESSTPDCAQSASELSAGVEGVVVTNGHLHSTILRAVLDAREAKKKQ